MSAQTEFSVLLVDDDEDCRLIIRDHLEDARLSGKVYEVSSGEEALAFARREPPFADVPRPGLIYLDIDMPTLDGMDVLRTLKTDERTKDIPIVMLTGINDARDMIQASALGANSYCVKASDPVQFAQTVVKATHYWLKTREKAVPA